jgi:SAM-dependent methyltransferase
MRILESLLLALNVAIAATGEPPREIPSGQYDAYTMGGAMAVGYWYFDETSGPDEPLVYTKQQIAECVAMARERQQRYYGITDAFLYEAFDAFRGQIAGKDVAIMGSTSPWYEGIVLAYEGRPTTIEYNKRVSEDPRLKVMTVDEYEAQPRQFDAVLSISSYEHDGLGRYGDPLNPEGDLVAMKKTLRMLRPGGLLFVAVPVGHDSVVWNAHRIYGHVRLPRFLEGWRVVQSFGFDERDLDRPADGSFTQPVFVLTPE